MEIFDTHCHYNHEPLWDNWREYWAAARAAGVTHATVVATDEVSAARAREIAASDPEYFVLALGWHPENVDKWLPARRGGAPGADGASQDIDEA
ncbi:TatD family hydrolase, partial [bacterium]|nr:TatD family hydrolase [bacterium]